MNNTETITTVDKDRRDRMFEDLRKNGNELERQVVKFSSNELIFVDGTPQYREVRYRLSGSKSPKIQYRPVYQSNWSVAYPRS